MLNLEKHMKKLIIFILSFAVLLSSFLPFAVFAYAEGTTVVGSGYCGASGNEENVTWVLDSDGTLAISGSGDMADYDPSVTGINQPWYESRESIVKVVIENGITRIGKRAFERCSRLEEAIIPGSVEIIQDSAFWGCASLSSINLPEGLKTICIYAFSGCARLQSIIIPASVIQIWGGAFENAGLTSITVRSGTPVYYSINNCVIHRETKKLVVGLSNCEIPTDGSVEIIGQMAFMSCSLEKIDIPDSVTCIETDAYWGLHSSSLQKVIVPDSVVAIHNSAFASNLVLEEIELPSGLDFISNMLFLQCRRLKSVNIPDGVTRIGWSAFEQCKALKSINIPKNVKKIGEKAFYESGLEYVFYEGTEEEWNQIDFGTGNEKLLNARIHFSATGHTPGTPEIENAVQPTCVETGSYDEVIRCTQCPLEISRSHVVKSVDPLNHKSTEFVPAVEATYDAHGFTEGVICKDCNTWISGHEVIHNTFGERRIVKEATKDAPGEVIITCTVCGESGLYEYQYENKPDEPEEEHLSLGERIRKAVNSIVNWILRLISWLGGKKK